jgi:23S rRNA (uracil1939-C5)-methyltransferase
MKKREIIVAKFAKFVPGGQAIGSLVEEENSPEIVAKYGTRKIFAWGVLPSETAEIEIVKSKKNWAEGFAGKTLSDENVSRISPRDECFLSTSPWQILDWKTELREKENLVRESFGQEKISFENGVFREIATDGEPFGYRNKMEYSLYSMSLAEAENRPEFREKFTAQDVKNGKRIFLAFHRRGSHGKIPILQSSIEKPEIFARANEILDELNSRNASAFDYQSLLLRANKNGEVSGDLFENFKPRPTMKNLSDELKIGGFSRKYSYSPNGFFQINLPVYELALDEILRNVGKEKNLVDMYSGVGSIGLSLLNENRKITLVETNESAIKEARENVKNLPKNLRENVKIIHAKSEDALENISRNSVLILDPPRAGLDEKVVIKIREIQPKKVIYLSCNPTTQARDISRILGGRNEILYKKTSRENGEKSQEILHDFREKSDYEIVSAQSFNFFPRTPHIENLIVLELR